eukprot:scaffold7006_cov174-Skeletonema_marinoi.AAC.16
MHSSDTQTQGWHTYSKCPEQTSRIEVSVPRHNRLESHGTSLSPNPKKRIVTPSAHESSL